jgi:[ribosomal protein S18]-alanine N-acetyltransferase
MQVALRDFQDADFERLWRIDQECFAPGISYSRQELAYFIRRRPGFTLVAHQGSTNAAIKSAIAGFIVVHTPRASGHVITIDVLLGARRHGIGSRLLDAAEERLRTLKASSVTLETAVDNTAALAFYKRHGFAVDKLMPRYYSNGVDALRLRKELG